MSEPTTDTRHAYLKRQIDYMKHLKRMPQTERAKFEINNLEQHINAYRKMITTWGEENIKERI